MSFVLHLMSLYSPQPTVAIQNCSIVTGDDYARFLRYVASESHLVACVLADLAALARLRLLWLRARAYPKDRLGGPLTNGPSGGGVRYLTTCLPFVLCSVRNLLKLGDFVKASDFRDMKFKFIKGILPHNLYLTTVWGLRGVVSQLILVLVVAGCG